MSFANVSSNLLGWFFHWLWEVSSNACTDYYLDEYLRGTFCRSPKFSLYTDLLPAISCPAHSKWPCLLQILSSVCSAQESHWVLLLFSTHVQQPGHLPWVQLSLHIHRICLHGFSHAWIENIRKECHKFPRNKTWICHMPTTIYIAFTLY